MEDYKEQTMKAYKMHAERYAEKFKGLTDVGRRYEFQRFLKLLHGNKIIDLGCGSGDHALYFKSNGLDVMCVDLSPEMVQICRNKGLNAQVMDMEKLDFPPESFDGAWMVTSLLHIPKAEVDNVAQRIHSMLKNLGILYVCVKKGNGEKMVAEEGGVQRFFSFWEEQELINKFEKYFDVVESKEASFNGREFIQIFFRKKD